jgi:hypothetical protein
MWITKNQLLLPSAFQNEADQRASPNSVAKVASPTQSLDRWRRR